MNSPIATTSTRLPALDVLRGLAIAGMILVTSPGDWNRAYAPLKHADWEGWTSTDMIFPAFLFSVGVALGLSFPRFLGDSASRRDFWWRVCRRTISLILLGLFLEATYNWAISLGAPFPGRAGLENLRIPGILQRIGFCYALAAILVVATARKDVEGRALINARALSLAIGAILILYWVLLTFVPVPGYGAGHLDPEGNLPAFIDRLVFTVPRLWPFGSAQWQGPVTYDPEGLLSSLPATTNVLFGVLAAREWRESGKSAALRIGVFGVVLLLAGLLLDPLFPINKRLWTSSFALLSSGYSAILLGAILAAVRFRRVVRLSTPLRILGGNAILAFVLATLLGRLYGFPLLRDGESPQHAINALSLRAVSDPYLASLVCAFAMLVVVTVMVWPLHRRAIHVRL
jgi:predicted acyltransferase